MPLPLPYVSPEDVANRVLRRLAVVADGQEPTADDARLVADDYAALHAEMTQKGEIDFPFEAVPQKAVDGIVGILAARSAGEFGKAALGDRGALIALARRQYFAVNARPKSAAPARGEYY